MWPNNGAANPKMFVVPTRKCTISVFIWSGTKHACCTIRAFLISALNLQRLCKLPFKSYANS